MAVLHIYDPRERRLVAAADRLLAAAAALSRPVRRRQPPASPARVLLLRLERIGDLVMALPAIQDVRALAPAASIDLVVGSWNAELARAIPGVDRVETLDAAWLARGADGLRLPSMLRAARAWRGRAYDLVINFEPDVRTNLVAAAAGARWSAGWRSGGGGALLDLALDYDPREHTSTNARRLVAAVLGSGGQGAGGPGGQGDGEPGGQRAGGPGGQRAEARSAKATIVLPVRARDAAAARLAGRARPLVGVHASGGREIKQWDPLRFAAVARRLIGERAATIVLTGAAADRPLVERVKAELPADRVVDLAGEPDLLTLAAVLERLDLFITGDTGPMHVASAVGTPVVAVFGPSDPLRYGPAGPRDRVVRVDLPCAPCNRIRLPPARCIGHLPDCLAGISADRVFDEAVAVLGAA